MPHSGAKSVERELSPIERMTSLDPPRTIRALKERIGVFVGNDDSPQTRARHEALVEDAVYYEKLRLQGESGSPANNAQRAFWKSVARRLRNGSPAEVNELIMEITAHFGREIHGHFSPVVYQAATQILPRGLGVLLSSLSSRVLLGHAQRAFDAVTNPSQQSLSELLKSLPQLSSQLIIQGQIETVQRLERKGTVILVPTHVSNLDSPLVGWIIYMMQLPPFAYGAGLNLFSNPLLGFFMRNLGAYTVDRKKRAELYKMTLKAYSTYVLERGMHSLFFPGGTRTRSGEVERHLKLGLLGTGLDAYVANLQNKKQQPNIYVVPATLSYQVVLEAETLIGEHLKGVGKSRYSITDDEFSQIEKIWSFVTNLISLGSKIYFTVSEPLDPFGNRVDADGISRDARGREIDITRYVMRDGYVVHDEQRDQEYTRELGERIAEAFYRDNVILTTHLTCFCIYQLMERAFPKVDLFKLLRLPWAEHPLPTLQVLEQMDRLLIVLRSMESEGKIRVGPYMRTHEPREVLRLAQKVLAGYHRKPPFVIEGERLIPVDPQLVLYYRNRLHGYGLEQYVTG